MKPNRQIVIVLISVIPGIIAFLGFNLFYAVYSIFGFSLILKTVLLILSLAFLSVFILGLVALARTKTTTRERIKYIGTITLAAIICGWITLIGVVYIMKYDVFYSNSSIRPKLSKQIQQKPENFEKIAIKTPDKIMLQGFLAKRSHSAKSPLAIYFGGRGEEASNIAEYAEKIKGWSLAFINYRGCGLSEGRQAENILFSDAVAVYDYFTGREDIDSKNIAIISHSLGTGVAIHLATEREVKGIVLSAPYDTYGTGVIQDKLPLVPASLLFTDVFDSVSVAPSVKTPAIFLLAEKDRTVYRKRSLKLLENWGGKAEKATIPGTHHESITINDVSWERINEFLESIIKME
ncbi:MAG: alpha/beta hydrolase [Clostridia bacterium]|nr:alpha/beta hydrolase [Clostridia bacterium]